MDESYGGNKTVDGRLRRTTAAATVEGAIVVVTGGSAGVGRAAAVEFARRGADVAVLARAGTGLQEARAEITQIGRRVIDIGVDVADADKLDAAAGRVERELGPIDVWVNNAMVSVLAPFEDIEADDFRRVTEVTYLGCVNGTRAALRRMRPRRRGKIVQVGSALAYRGIPLQSPYCGAKHAIRGFTESLRCELMHDRSGIGLSIVHLPALNTPQFHWVKTTLRRHPKPVPPIYQPEIAAEAIVWAATHDRAEINVGAPTSLTIAVNKLAPRLLDRYLARTGYGAQQADFPTEPGRPDNLHRPVEAGHGAHGEFDDGARDSSLQWWATRHRGLLAAGGAALATAAALAARRG